MIILLDLDGTLIDTNSDQYNDIKYGYLRNFSLKDIPIIKGAYEFVQFLKEKGYSVSIISDSHDAYVKPIAENIFSVPYLALANKPNTIKTRNYIEKHFGYSESENTEDFLFIGDTNLDIELARGLYIPSILLDKDNKPNAFNIGATYKCRSFHEAKKIIQNPSRYRLALEDTNGIASARIDTHQNCNGGITIIRGLARQQQGPCDKYGAIKKYYEFENKERNDNFLSEIANDIKKYLEYIIASSNRMKWDILTCVADKKTTQNSQKMQELLQRIDINIEKKNIFSWSSQVDGSTRKQKHRETRMKFIRKYVSVDSNLNLKDKNIIILDDQYTTGATANTHINMLLNAGAKNILFISLFYITNNVPIEKNCPQCGKMLQIKYRRCDGNHFYSCVSPKYNGTGCGWTGSIDHETN